MESKGKLIGATVDFKTHKRLLTFEVDNVSDDELNRLFGVDTLDIKAVRHTEKRSNEANAYHWKLCGLLAAAWFEKYKKDCLPLLDREVRESYMSEPIVDDARCILIDGNEIGGYWMVSEAKESPVSFKGLSQRLEYGEV